MKLPVNTFKQALRAGKPQLGLWVGLNDNCATEICAGANFDWLLLDAEHAPKDIGTLLTQLQVIAAYRSHPVVRPWSGDRHLIKRLLDIGAQTLLVPMVETAAGAAELVQAMRYPPGGVRGVGSALARASRWTRVPSYLAGAATELCLLVQVETRAGLENIDAIAEVEGVDGVFIGPSDLAASMGHLGQPGHPEVRERIEAAITRLQERGRAVGILTTDRALARHYLALGCRFVAVGIDTVLFSDAVSGLAREFGLESP